MPRRPCDKITLKYYTVNILFIKTCCYTISNCFNHRMTRKILASFEYNGTYEEKQKTGLNFYGTDSVHKRTIVSPWRRFDLWPWRFLELRPHNDFRGPRDRFAIDNIIILNKSYARVYVYTCVCVCVGSTYKRPQTEFDSIVMQINALL